MTAPTSALAPRRLRVALAVTLVLTLLAVIIATFWYQDWRYSLPAPRPANWQPAMVGTGIPLPPGIAAVRHVPGGPLCLHFFNPSCPCSRFNLDHLRELAWEFRGQADCVAVLQTAEDGAEEEFEKLLPGMAAVKDPEGRLARRCGVYATPQAVVLGADGRLLFCGNYNLSRYCTRPDTQFVRLALAAAVTGRAQPVLPGAAFTAYGCALPQRPWEHSLQEEVAFDR